MKGVGRHMIVHVCPKAANKSHANKPLFVSESLKARFTCLACRQLLFANTTFEEVIGLRGVPQYTSKACKNCLPTQWP
jgi:hypothetical protein